MPERLLAKHGGAALQAHRDRVAALTVLDDPPLPDYVINYLVQVRLGNDIPFSYLVPDEALLPGESIRFFTVDEAWLDSLMDGILAVGGSSTRDTEHVAAVLPSVKVAVRSAVPMAAGLRRRTVTRREIAAHVGARATIAARGQTDAADVPDLPEPAPVTGFLMRSALVSGYPGFSVRAFTTTNIADGTDPSTVPESQYVQILRMEQLAPTVLLVLFAGTPQLVWIEEPHHGIQLGVDENDEITPVNADGTERTPPATPIPVPMRAGAVPKVVDVDKLATSLGVSGSAALATQLLRPPYRMRFSADAQQ